MWGWTFLVIAAFFAWQARRVGLRRALGAAVFVSLLVPTWAHLGYQSAGGAVQMTGEEVDMRVAIAFVGVLACLVRPRGKLSPRVTAVDLALVLLMAVHVIADWRAQGVGAGPLLRAWGEWGLPYLAGRIAIQSADDLRNLLPVVLSVLGILTSIAVFESLTGINPFEIAYGPRPLDYMGPATVRWGILRACGPTRNTIFLGMLFLLFLPWTLHAAALAWRRQAPVWWGLTPLVMGLGIAATASRAPIVGAALALCCVVYLKAPVTRWPIVGLGVCLIVVVAMNFTAFLETMERWAGDNQVRARNGVFGADGRVVGVSGTTTRIYLFDVYGDALRRAGFLGFGTTAVADFPVNVPMGPQNLALLNAVPYIDDIYVLITLRFGYLGLAAFVAFFATSIVDWARHAIARDRSSLYAAAAAGAIVGAMLAMATLWMPHDFGFLLIWLAGAGAGLRAGAVPQRARRTQESEKIRNR